MKNELNNSTSPYLLQHALNPVHWKVWNEENIDNAKNNNQLLLISIGYAACHWCHVMEKECFEDDDVAKVMNTYFTNFKIDREELPVVDAYYMQAMQIMTKTGGWPLNVIALPNGLPIWAATYVPKEEWIAVLLQLNDLFLNDTERVVEYANKLQDSIEFANNISELFPKQNFSSDYLPLIDKWKKSFDLEYGGYLRAPKFMMPTNLNFLIKYYDIYKDVTIKNHLETTLTNMAYGGLFDVIEGGFSRYSVDHKWHIPHFEKMLYDNAQLLTTYTTAFLNTNNSHYKEILDKTVKFITRNWLDSSGGFYASYDADSKNSTNKMEEGAFYYWKKEHLKQLIKVDEWQVFKEVYNINDYGFWHEANAYVLIQNQSLKSIAYNNNLSIQTLSQMKENWEYTILTDRAKREYPRLDNKIITSWNAMLLTGLITSTKVTNNQSIRSTITNLSSYLKNEVFNGEILFRIANTKTEINGVLEDYAFTIKSFLDLFKYSQEREHLFFAKELTYIAIDKFFDQNKGFFSASEDDKFGLIFEIEDNVIPSSNAIMCLNLFYLGKLFKNEHFTSLSKEMLFRVLDKVDFASAYSEWLYNDLTINKDFEYIIINNTSQNELDELFKISKDKLIIDIKSNLPISNDYQKQKYKYQICNNNSCRIATNNILDIF